MNHVIFKDIETFALHYFSAEQTVLVETLLEMDDHLNLIDTLHNAEYYTAELSIGRFHGVFTELVSKQERIEQLLKSMKADTLQHEVFSRDRDILESATTIKRMVYQWYAIPYWIADYFIRHGEVVLIWQGLCWWGRTTTGQYVFMDKAVKQLFNCQSSFIPE